MPRERIDEPGRDARAKVGRLAEYLDRIDNAVQLSWLCEMSRELFDLEIDRFDRSNWQTVYDAAAQKLASPNWENEILRRSKVKKIFLTNEFDDPLEGFDANRYVPCLRTDELVFHFASPGVRERLTKASGIDLKDEATLRQAIGALFTRFVAKGAKACAISLPPGFTPTKVSKSATAGAIQSALAGRELTAEASGVLSKFVFWTLAELCAEHRLPFDLMIGVNRKVYPSGVFQGQDLYDSRTSLIQYADLFNAFPQVTFPISVLAQTSNQELVSYAWIFPNVVANGHWWYSNIPAHIETDTRARLQAVPRTKLVGYYSDAYKLEFILPKFAMYKRILADVLFRDFVVGRGWPEERAVDLGKQVLRGNIERIFDV